MLDDCHAASALREEQHELALGVEPEWRRDVYSGAVERFGSPRARCHLRWNELVLRDDPSFHACPACGERVTHRGSVTDAGITAGYSYEAVVVDPAERGSHDDLYPAPELFTPVG